MIIQKIRKIIIQTEYYYGNIKIFNMNKNLFKNNRRNYIHNKKYETL